MRLRPQMRGGRPDRAWRRGRRAAVWAGIALAVALVPAAAFSSHVTRESVAVGVGAGGQFDPSIKGDLIAYTDTSIAANGADIVVYRISDGTTVRVADSGGAQEVQDVDGNFVVFRQWNEGEAEGEIFVYSLSAGSYTQITDDLTQQRDPAISGTRIIWTDVATSTIWLANIDGSGTRAIAPGGFQSAPAIDGNLVVWVENGSVVSYDLANEAAGKTVIAAGSAPDVHGTKIVYASGGDIWLKDGPAAPVNLTNNAATQRNPKVSDTMVAWEEVVSPTDVDIFAYDFRTNTIEPLASGAGIQDLHDLDGTNLAFTDRSMAAQGDIYLLRELAVVVIPADLALDPSTINLRSKGPYVTVRLEFPAGRDPATVDVASVTLQAIDPVTSAKLPVAAGAPTAVGDADGDGITDLTIRFDRATVQSWFSAAADPATFRVEGKFGDGTAFEGEASARVIAAGVVHTDNADPASVQDSTG